MEYGWKVHRDCLAPKQLSQAPTYMQTTCVATPDRAHSWPAGVQVCNKTDVRARRHTQACTQAGKSDTQSVTQALQYPCTPALKHKIKQNRTQAWQQAKAHSRMQDCRHAGMQTCRHQCAMSHAALLRMYYVQMNTRARRCPSMHMMCAYVCEHQHLHLHTRTPTPKTTPTPTPTPTLKPTH